LIKITDAHVISSFEGKVRYRTLKEWELKILVDEIADYLRTRQGEQILIKAEVSSE